MSAWARIGRWLPVLFVTGLIAWCFLVFMLDILIPLLDSPDKAQHDYGLGCTIAFNIIFSLAMISFLRAVFTDPGYIPDSWSVHPDDLESGERTRLMPAVLQTQEKKHDGTVRICRKSKPAMYKPDRAHYCRVMQRCVLKMDHFCPWLNNCIGFYNHKFFVLFVAYMAMITVFMVFVMTPVFVNIVSNMEQITLDLKDQEFHVSLTYLMLCLLSVGLSAFFIFHAYLVLFNYTTIEFLEKRGCQPPPDHVNRYHLGPLGNVCSVFGSNPLTWWLPVRWTVEGDGLSFRLNPGLKTL
jgi:palmitoyltransferase